MGVLERVDEKPKTEEVVAPVQPALPIMPVIARPEKIEGATYKTETPMGETFITINHTEDKQPFEVFITIGKSGSDVSAMAEALARMISLNLRVNSTLAPRERIRQIVAQLTGIGGSRSIGFGANRVRSLPDAIAKVLATHFSFAVNGKVEDRKVIEEVMTQGEVLGEVEAHSISSVQAPLTHVMHEEEPVVQAVGSTGSLPAAGQQQIFADKPSSNTNLYDICPECGVSAFAYEDGCKKCYNCGHSEC
jgi:ribonucleoside-diphosphate reductase alpha chain